MWKRNSGTLVLKDDKMSVLLHYRNGMKTVMMMMMMAMTSMLFVTVIMLSVLKMMT